MEENLRRNQVHLENDCLMEVIVVVIGWCCSSWRRFWLLPASCQMFADWWQVSAGTAGKVWHQTAASYIESCMLYFLHILISCMRLTNNIWPQTHTHSADGLVSYSVKMHHFFFSCCPGAAWNETMKQRFPDGRIVLEWECQSCRGNLGRVVYWRHKLLEYWFFSWLVLWH